MVAMSMVLTRSPLESIGMNGAGQGGAGAPKRRSARLSNEGVDENESSFAYGQPAATRSKTTVVGTKEGDGEGSGVAAKRKKRGKISPLYFDFAFGLRGRSARQSSGLRQQ